jgi:hypothetical protein
MLAQVRRFVNGETSLLPRLSMRLPRSPAVVISDNNSRFLLSDLSARPRLMEGGGDHFPSADRSRVMSAIPPKADMRSATRTSALCQNITLLCEALERTKFVPVIFHDDASRAVPSASNGVLRLSAKSEGFAGQRNLFRTDAQLARTGGPDRTVRAWLARQRLSRHGLGAAFVPRHRSTQETQPDVMSKGAPGGW